MHAHLHTYIHTHECMYTYPHECTYIWQQQLLQREKDWGTERTQLTELVQLRKTTKKMVLEWWMCPTMRGSWSLWTDDMSRKRVVLEKVLGCWRRIAFDLRIDAPYWCEPWGFLSTVKKWIFPPLGCNQNHQDFKGKDSYSWESVGKTWHLSRRPFSELLMSEQRLGLYPGVCPWLLTASHHRLSMAKTWRQKLIGRHPPRSHYLSLGVSSTR